MSSIREAEATVRQAQQHLADLKHDEVVKQLRQVRSNGRTVSAQLQASKTVFNEFAAVEQRSERELADLNTQIFAHEKARPMVFPSEQEITNWEKELSKLQAKHKAVRTRLSDARSNVAYQRMRVIQLDKELTALLRQQENLESVLSGDIASGWQHDVTRV